MDLESTLYWIYVVVMAIGAITFIVSPQYLNSYTLHVKDIYFTAMSVAVIVLSLI